MKHLTIASLALSLISFFAVSFVVVESASAEDAPAYNIPTDNEFEAAATLSYEELNESRGTNNPVSTNYLLATSSGNTANNTVSGENTISDGAFGNSSGFVNVIQNSGNNVVIQSATTLSVTLAQ